MSERLKVKDVLTNPKTVAAMLLASLALAGCGGTTKYTNDIKVGSCGSHDISMPAGAPGADVSEAVATAKKNVLTLQQRALQVGGSIDLNRFNETTEIQASSDELTLSFRRQSYDYVGDHVHFPIKNGAPEVSEGAVVCFDKEQLVTNGTYQTLQQYVDQTAGLEQ